MQKRIACFWLFVVVLIASFTVVTEAAIERKVDKFDGKVSLNSTIDYLSPFQRVAFFKTISPQPEQSTYGLFFAIRSFDEWWFFSKQPAELKVDDGETIYKLLVFDTMSEMKGGVTNYVLLTGVAIFPHPDAINLLHKAKKATFRIHFDNQPAVIWDVPADVLKEWKDVIVDRLQ